MLSYCCRCETVKKHWFHCSAPSFPAITLSLSAAVCQSQCHKPPPSPPLLHFVFKFCVADHGKTFFIQDSHVTLFLPLGAHCGASILELQLILKKVNSYNKLNKSCDSVSQTGKRWLYADKQKSTPSPPKTNQIKSNQEQMRFPFKAENLSSEPLLGCFLLPFFTTRICFRLFVCC